MTTMPTSQEVLPDSLCSGCEMNLGCPKAYTAPTGCLPPKPRFKRDLPEATK